MTEQEILQRVLQEIARVQKETVLVAIDGRCASGKTTLAAGIAKALPCNVFHTDDFFLRPEQRTAERYAQPGGNMDRERFLQEVLLSLERGEPFCYRPFDCKTMRLKDPVAVCPVRVRIVEGTYSCHPALADRYDLRIFLTVEPNEQLARLARRKDADLSAFREKWIPLEEAYFAELAPEKRCEILLQS